MLEVNKLGRSYGDFVAVDNVSFAIGKGEIVGLLGHNGAGKTTIMKMLSGYLEPNGGDIIVDGLNLAQDAKKVQQSLGYLPENPPIYPELSVADYLDYAAQLKGLQGNNKAAEVRRVILATDIAVKLLSPIATLSRGYKQRVGVAQALLGKPKLLILDEPTNGLDPTQTEHMRQLLRDIAQHATVILSTHIMQEVDALCDRVLILRDGKLAVDERLDKLRHSNHLLLCTSMDAASLGSTLEQNERLQGIQFEALADERANACYYRLTLTDNADQQAISAVLAQAIVQANAELFELRLEHRDLETLFKEVSKSQEASNSQKASKSQTASTPTSTDKEGISDAA
jgi:ABC-2 type transport system ATP-binding protein